MTRSRADLLDGIRRLLDGIPPQEAEAMLREAAEEQRVLAAEDGPPPADVRVGGVDACRGGWVLATSAADGSGPTSVRVIGSFAEIVELVEAGSLAAVGVDIPIGLPEGGSRACDTSARELVGARRSSVFPTPARNVLDAPTWRDANEQSRALHGKGVARQTFGIMARIREVDELMTPDLQDRIVEVHPEVSFAVMTGRPMDAPKHGAQGRSQRRVVLEQEFPDVRRQIMSRIRGAATDDVLDAYAVLWSARRFFHGLDQALGDGTRDARGLRMQIVV